VKVFVAVKVFLWKACNNILPTKLNIHKKRCHGGLNTLFASWQKNQWNTSYGTVNPHEIHGLLVVAKSKNAQLWRSHFLVFLYGKLATTLFPQNSTSVKKRCHGGLYALFTS
jgi:hypothetical protein